MQAPEPNKDSKKVRVRSCPAVLRVPAEHGVHDVVLTCQLKRGEPENHTVHEVKGYVFRKNGTALKYLVHWEELGRAEARQHRYD